MKAASSETRKRQALAFGAAQAPLRRAAFKCLEVHLSLTCETQYQVSLDEPRSDGVDTDGRSPLRGEEPGQHHQSRLRGRVSESFGKGRERGQRGDVHYVSASLRQHRTPGALRAQEGRREVDVQGSLP